MYGELLGQDASLKIYKGEREKLGMKASEDNEVQRKCQLSWKEVTKNKLSLEKLKVKQEWLGSSTYTMLSVWLGEANKKQSMEWLLEHPKVFQLKTISHLCSSQWAVVEDIWVENFMATLQKFDVF